MAAALLGGAQCTFANELSIGDGKAAIVREIDGGLETIELVLPAVITADLRLNTPRYASLPSIMKAKKKPLEETTPQQIKVDLSRRLEVMSVREPPTRKAGSKVKDTAVLAHALRAQGGIV